MGHCNWNLHPTYTRPEGTFTPLFPFDCLEGPSLVLTIRYIWVMVGTFVDGSTKLFYIEGWWRSGLWGDSLRLTNKSWRGGWSQFSSFHQVDVKGEVGDEGRVPDKPYVQFQCWDTTRVVDFGRGGMPSNKSEGHRRKEVVTLLLLIPLVVRWSIVTTLLNYSILLNLQSVLLIPVDTIV